LAKKQVDSGAAWNYMQKLIKAQNAVHNLKPDQKNISYL
jgi:hypothetical protein